MLKRTQYHPVLFIGIIYILCIGGFATWFMANQAENDLQEDIYYTVELGLAATNPAIVEDLPVTEKDVHDPNYLRLREQYLKLQKPMEEKDIRWIYIMKVFPEEVRFVVDSVPVNDIGHSEPGVVYEEPPQAVFDALLQGTQQFVGPFTDEYGTYYSVFAPLRNSEHRIVGILGADMEAWRYEQIIRRKLIAPMIGTVISLILFIFIFFYIEHLRHNERVKSEFISIASHQLKTPITGLKWITEDLVKDKKVRSIVSVRRQIKELGSIIRHLSELVDSLLNVSRIDMGRIEVHKQPVNLEKLVVAEIKEVKAITRRKGQSLTFSAGTHIPIMQTDPLLVQETVKNLLTNAIKYTPNKGKITVRLTRFGGFVTLRVTDNGYGIPQAEQGRLFEKFYRGSNIVQLESDGNGLGLYFVKKIVELLKGKIVFSSKEGKGTTFTVSLPIA